MNVDDEENVENTMLQTASDILDASIQAAQFSINVIDLLDPPKPIRLGKWNARALKESEAIKLKTQMLMDDIRPFQFENLLRCVIDPKFVDPACVQPSILGGIHGAPALKLSAEGERTLATIDLVGGRHRKRAINLIKLEREDALNQMRESLKRHEEKAEKGGAKADEMKTSIEAIMTR